MDQTAFQKHDQHPKRTKYSARSHRDSRDLDNDASVLGNSGQDLSASSVIPQTNPSSSSSSSHFKSNSSPTDSIARAGSNKINRKVGISSARSDRSRKNQSYKVMARSITQASLRNPVTKFGTCTNETLVRNAPPSFPSPGQSNYPTALDTLLASLETSYQLTRSNSEPFINSWTYNSASFVVPITHPLLRSHISFRVAPLKKKAQSRFKLEMPLSLPLSGITGNENSEKKRKHKQEEGAANSNANIASSEKATKYSSDKSLTDSHNRSSSIKKVKELEIPVHLVRSGSKENFEVPIVKDKSNSKLKNKTKTKSRSGSVAEKSKSDTNLAATVLALSVPNSPESQSPISQSSALSAKQSPETSDSDLEDDSNGRLAMSAEFGNGSAKHKKLKGRKLSKSSTVSSESLNELLDTETTDTSKESKSKLRKRAKSLRSDDETEVPPLQTKSARRRKSKGNDDMPQPIVAPPPKRKAVPDQMWLTNPASDKHCKSFFEFLKSNFKDSQLCEAIIMMHTEVFCSRYLLDRLLQWYSDPEKESVPLSGQNLSASSSNGNSSKNAPSGLTPLYGTRTSIFNFLKKWVRLNTQDFLDDHVLMDMIQDFAMDLQRKPGLECQMATLILEMLESSSSRLDDDPNSMLFNNDELCQLMIGNSANLFQYSPHNGSSTPTPNSGTKSDRSRSFSGISSGSNSPPGSPITKKLLKVSDMPTPQLGNYFLDHLLTNETLPGLIYVSPLEIARQTCLLDHSALIEIRIRDFLRFADHPEKSASLSAVATSFNKQTSWVASQILGVANSKERSRVVSHLIAIAEILLEFNNFHSFLAFIVGLTQISVARLRDTWKRVGKRELKSLRNMQQLASPLSNFAGLRRDYENCTPPFVPSPAMFLKDLVFVTESSHKGYIDPTNDQVNADKIRVVEKVLGRLHAAQRNHYQFVPIKCIQDMLQQGETLSFEELDSWSARVEPGRDL